MSIKKMLLKYNIINHIRIKKLRNRLQNGNITILSSNCLGGLLYHELGLKFMSPTVNLRFSSKDFLKFVLNLEHYLQLEIIEIESDESYPVGLLGDITLHFVHYSSFNEAVAAWKKRRTRINWDNLYILMNDCDGITEEQLIALDESRFCNIIVFTAKRYPERRCCFYLPRFKGRECVGNTMAKNMVTGEMVVQRDFDFVGWFNCDNGSELECYRR